MLGEQRVERLEGQERLLHAPDPGREEHDRPRRALERGGGGPVPGLSRLEERALGNHQDPGRRVGQGLHDRGLHRFVEHADRGRALQDPAHDRRRVRILQIVVDVGAGDRHQQGHARAAGQAKRRRTGAEGVEGVHDRGAELAELVLHRGLGHHGQIPDANLHPALPEPVGDPVDRDRVAPDRRSGERRQDRDTTGHECDEPTL